ncbi:MAG TPA: PstS family phosphate ABC transporter substrate-binding protein [Longimicrobiales bacterium]|nr:PstS family phosphate ABC transporter substrate-binding protein [Longimicrobiales bacterium]
MIGRTNAMAMTAVALLVTACGGGERGTDGLSGRVELDGSSTVFPISEAVAEEFSFSASAGVQVTVGQSGTGGGFKRFCTGETDISNASREIKESEIAECAVNGVEYERFAVALDGMAIVVHAENDWVECVTVDELRSIWEPGSAVRNWSDVRPEWPASQMRLYGPGTNSGTFDYFTEAIMGEMAVSRPDYVASEDDNVLVQGVEGDQYSLGYFGYAYYHENQTRLRAVAVDGGSGCVMPTIETINSGEYSPLSRPLFIYVNTASLQRPEVARFVEFYLEQGAELVPQTGYIALPASDYEQGLNRLAELTGG